MLPIKMALLPRLPLLALTLAALFHAGGSSAAEGHPLIVKLDDLQYSQQQLTAKTRRLSAPITSCFPLPIAPSSSRSTPSWIKA